MVKLTKNELKQQRDALKMYRRYLPTLQLKKQQLQTVIRQVELQVQERREVHAQTYNGLLSWIGVFGDDAGRPDDGGSTDAVDIASLVRVRTIVRSTGNIAGVDIPMFEGIEFETVPYDLFAAPLWVDTAVRVLKSLVALDAEIIVLEEQVRLLSDELRITTQRVNLFEKVKIPETRENIRRIQIYIGDQQTAAVVRGKISKNKVQKVSGS